MAQRVKVLVTKRRPEFNPHDKPDDPSSIPKTHTGGGREGEIDTYKLTSDLYMWLW